MAVLVEGISVIIKRKVIEEKFPGGWEAFVGDVPNRTLCADESLARVGFMTPVDVEAYVKRLGAYGFQYVADGEAIDLVVADQLRGPAAKCDWCQFGHVDIGKEKPERVAACRFVGSTANVLIFPDGWEYEKSLSKSSGFLPNGESEQSLEFLRHENGVDVYLNKLTGKEVYMGRTGERQQ